MDRFKRFFDFAPYFVFFVFLLLSVFLYELSVRSLEREIANTFRITADELSNSVESRMKMYEQILRSGEGLFQANGDKVTRRMWHDYNEKLALDENFTGILAIGFTEIVEKEDAEAHILRMRKTGLKDYAIKPSADRDRMAVVTIMYPETEENLRVLGFDLSSEPVRAALFKYAEESMDTGISGKMILKQEIDENSAPAGILMARPMFRDGKLYGFIAAPFRVNSLMYGIFGNNLNGLSLDIYDIEAKEENLMFSTENRDESSIYRLDIPMDMYGRVWILRYTARPEFLAQFDHNKPLIILLGGLLTGILFAMLTFILLKTRKKAYEIAEHMSRKFLESEDRYRRTYEQVAVGIVMTTLDGNIMKTNSFFKEITRYGEEELDNLCFCEMFEESCSDELQGILEKLTKRRIDSYYTEKQITLKNGSKLWTGITVSAFFDSNEMPIYLLIVVEDISKRKKAEEAIVSLSMRQAAILDNSLVAIIQLRGDVIEWVNSAYETMFGYSAEEVIGQTTLVMSETEQKHKNLVKNIMEAESYKKHGVVRTQAQFLRKDGRLIWADISGKLIDNSSVRASIWVLNDITDRIRAEQMLKNLNAGLETKVSDEISRRVEQERLLMHQSRLAAMGEMIGAIAHQWRQPLNILSLMIQNVSEDFLDRSLTDTGMKEFSEHSLKQLHYMSDTIDDFRNFFRSDNDCDVFSPYTQVENVQKLLHSQLESKNIVLNIAERGQGLVSGVANEFAQVVLNLINNSKDAFLEQKTQNPRIDIEIDSINGHLEIIIKDNGGGIPAEIAEKIFDPYFTTKGPDKGTGIGLYMSKIIIHDHFGGRLSFRNTDDGCEFVITLPKTADIL